MTNGGIISILHNSSNELQHRSNSFRKTKRLQVKLKASQVNTHHNWIRKEGGKCSCIPVPPAIIPTYFTCLKTGSDFLSGRMAKTPEEATRQKMNRSFNYYAGSGGERINPTHLTSPSSSLPPPHLFLNRRIQELGKGFWLNSKKAKSLVCVAR